MTTRRFYRTVFEVEVLSDEPLRSQDFAYTWRECQEGKCSAGIKVVERTTHNGPMAAVILKQHGSFPESFGLTPDGADLDEYLIDD